MTVEFALNVACGARGNHNGSASHEQRIDRASLHFANFVCQSQPHRGCFRRDASPIKIVVHIREGHFVSDAPARSGLQACR